MIGYETFYYVDTKFRGVKFNWWKLDQIFISLQIKTDGRLFFFSGKIKTFPLTTAIFMRLLFFNYEGNPGDNIRFTMKICNQVNLSETYYYFLFR